MKVLVILLTLLLCGIVTGQDDYSIFYRSYEAVYCNYDSTVFIKSVVKINKDSTWTYDVKFFSDKNHTLLHREENRIGKWIPCGDDEIYVHLRCDLVKVSSTEWMWDNTIVYKRYPPYNTEVVYDYYMTFTLEEGFSIWRRHCNECDNYIKLYIYGLDKTEKLL